MLVNKFEDWDGHKLFKKVSKSKLISTLTDNMVFIEGIRLSSKENIKANIYTLDDSSSLIENLKNEMKFDIINVKGDEIEIGYTNKGIKLID